MVNKGKHEGKVNQELGMNTQTLLYIIHTHTYNGISWWLGSESACNVGDLSSIPRLGRSPGGGHGNPLQYYSLENPHGQRSLVGYTPWGCKESGRTERLSTHNLCNILCKHLIVGAFNFVSEEPEKSSNLSDVSQLKHAGKRLQENTSKGNGWISIRESQLSFFPYNLL